MDRNPVSPARHCASPASSARDFQEEAGVLRQRVPLCAKRVFHIHCGPGCLLEILEQRPGVEVYGLETDAPLAARAAPHCQTLFDTPLRDTTLPFSEDDLDCIVLSGVEPMDDALRSMLRVVAPLLSPTGSLVIPVGPFLQDEKTRQVAALQTGVVQAGLSVYGMYPWLAVPYDIDETGEQFRGGRGVLVAVHPAYNPVEHARACMDTTRADHAYEILSAIPAVHRQRPEADAVVQIEKQIALLTMAQPGGGYPLLRCFAAARTSFHRFQAAAALNPIGYRTMAEFWHQLGGDNMARRLLRSIDYAAPDAGVREQGARYAAPAPRPEDETPAWVEERPMRVLALLTHERVHYGQDVLYDGLCQVLGNQSVTEFPWKPTLHGHRPEECARYPALFDHPGEPCDIESLIDALRNGAFDVILFGDIERRVEPGLIRRILDTVPGLPLFVLDAQDDCQNHLPDTLAYLGRSEAHGYFKREYLECMDFGATTWPLPFAYPDGRVATGITGKRSQPLFWAGERRSGLRNLYLSHVEQRFGLRLDGHYEQSAYLEALRSARIGLCFAGGGFDTVRYWELPANGCMLLAERPPIRIPHNFRDGETAVFFDDLQELEEKLEYYLGHPEETTAIAHAGHEHLKAHHTGSARARQMLARIDDVLHHT